MYGSEEMTAAHEHYGDVVATALRVDEQEIFGESYREEVDRLIEQLTNVPHEQRVKAIACYAHLVAMRSADTRRVIGL